MRYEDYKAAPWLKRGWQGIALIPTLAFNMEEWK